MWSRICQQMKQERPVMRMWQPAPTSWPGTVSTFPPSGTGQLTVYTPCILRKSGISLSQMRVRTTRFLLSTKISPRNRQSCLTLHLLATMALQHDGPQGDVVLHAQRPPGLLPTRGQHPGEVDPPVSHARDLCCGCSNLQRDERKSPIDPELCACVNDITGNGILIEMANIAKQLKYFGSKRRPRKAPQLCIPRPRLNIYIRLGYGCGRKKRAAENTESDEAKIAEHEQEYLANPTHEAANSLLDARPWKTNTLVGPEQWISYQAMLTTSMLEEKELNDFATFMYCRLNQPDTDHPKDLFD